MFSKLNAQECGTELPENYETYETLENRIINQPNYCINLFFRIVRDDNGSNGFNASEIPALLNAIRPYFSAHQITFYNVGFDYINNSAFNNQNATFITPQNIPNAINIFIKKIVKHNGTVISGVAFGSSSTWINSISIESVKDVFAHELGHNLNLLHTHQCYSNPYAVSCLEAINGSNCNTAGDMICDTPADPFQCPDPLVITSQFNPNKKNLMSYYTTFTKDHFTSGQGLRMRTAILNKPDIQSLRSYQCSNIIGNNYICPSIENSYSIDVYGSPLSCLWSVSSNLQIVGSTSGTSVNVQTANATITGVYGTLTLLISGTILTKQIWIGAPNGNVFPPIIGAHDWVCRGVTTNNVVGITGNPTAIFYKWKIEIDTTFGPGYNCNGVTNPSYAKFNSNQSTVLVNAPEYTDSNGTISTFINVPAYTDYSTTPSTSINWGRCSGNYRLSLYAKNDCGEAIIATKNVTVGSPSSNPCINQDPLYPSNFRMIISPNPIRQGETSVSLLPNQLPCDFDNMREGINYKEIYGKNYQIKVYDFMENKNMKVNLN